MQDRFSPKGSLLIALLYGALGNASAALPPLKPGEIRLNRDLTVLAGSHEVVQELDVVYWRDRPALPKAIAKEDTEYRPYFHYHAPKDAKGSLPGILLVHGGGFGAGDPASFHTKFPLGPWLASHGYAVFSTGYTLRNRTTRRVAAIDLRQAIRFIRKNSERFNVNPERLGAWGFSAGAMAMGQMLKMPENAAIKERLTNASGEKITMELPTDGGPLASSGIPTRLQVMIFSSGHEVRTDDAKKRIPTFAGRAPDAIFLYQSPGEKPQSKGRVPDDHPMRKEYKALGTTFEGYGVIGGKHCPNLRLTIERNGKEVPLHSAILSFLNEHLEVKSGK